ncbi:MAG TPA: hypothetical protein VKG79_04280 [Bryobacteraceae bacterium]|nr:hypothetical protein [Bryobacteraceae bacterium]
MAFCANCGSQVDGRFCQKCGAAVGAGPAPGANPLPPPTPTAGLGMDENVAAALCYIPLIGIIFLVVDPYNKNRTIRFHAFQSLFYLAAWIVAGICLRIIGSILFAAMPFGIWQLWLLLSRLVELALFVGLILLAVKAYQGQRFLAPVIGPMAEKQAGA